MDQLEAPKHHDTRHPKCSASPVPSHPRKSKSQNQQSGPRIAGPESFFSLRPPQLADRQRAPFTPPPATCRTTSGPNIFIRLKHGSRFNHDSIKRACSVEEKTYRAQRSGAPNGVYLQYTNLLNLGCSSLRSCGAFTTVQNGTGFLTAARGRRSGRVDRRQEDGINFEPLFVVFITTHSTSNALRRLSYRIPENPSHKTTNRTPELRGRDHFSHSTPTPPPATCRTTSGYFSLPGSGGKMPRNRMVQRGLNTSS